MKNLPATGICSLLDANEGDGKVELPFDQELFTELAASLSPGAVVLHQEPLARRTTLRVGGPADYYVEPANEDDLARLFQFCSRHRMPFFLLGRGSNLLVRDGGVRGVVACLNAPFFSRIEVEGERLFCGAGAKLKAVAHEARRHGLSGLEFFEGIPGSVGGALRMNAGAMGGWTFQTVETMRFMEYDGQIREVSSKAVKVNYRECPQLRRQAALSAVFKCVPAPVEEIAQRMAEYNRKRWTSQPPAPSAGCIFKNPSSIPAGRLIDELGLKNARVGGAAVSEAHGNFIVNTGAATAKDVLELIEMLKERARLERGIELETEVEIIGE